LTYLVWVILAY